MVRAAATPTRLDRNVFAAAKAAAALTGRTVAEQLSHWARVGDEVEAVNLVALSRRRRTSDELLDGRGYDTLTADEGAQVRAAWSGEIDQRIEEADVAAGRPVIVLDDDGNVVRHMPDGTIESL